VLGIGLMASFIGWEGYCKCLFKSGGIETSLSFVIPLRSLQQSLTRVDQRCRVTGLHVVHYIGILAVSIHAKCSQIFSPQSRHPSATTSHRWYFGQCFRWTGLASCQQQTPDRNRRSGLSRLFHLACNNERRELILGVYFPFPTAIGHRCRPAV